MSKAARGMLLVLLVLSVGAMSGQFATSVMGQGDGKFAMVLDVGGKGDLSFNDMGLIGANRAVEELGLQFDLFESASANDYLPNIQNAARSGQYEIIIAVGFLLADAIAEVAAQFPDQKFAIIDVTFLSGDNIMQIDFSENQGSALVGALAAMVAGVLGAPNVGVVLGIEFSTLWHFEVGYRFGIDWGNKRSELITGSNPNVNMLWTYTGTFDDIALGKAATEAMLAQGAAFIFNVAGPLGLGDLEAIEEKIDAEKGPDAPGPPFLIGVDANQDFLAAGHRVMASMLKRVDVGVFSAVQAAVDGTFAGTKTTLGMAEGAISISRYKELLEFIDFGVNAGAIKASDSASITSNWLAMRDAVPYWIWDSISELEREILLGNIIVPTADTDAEIKAKRAQFPLGD